ncbi:hypothetical protein FOIG_07673 [Fusarium odoratissimum NRRL 54006]|uniref:Uncharacterized protein n=2 Tax=Fusarium oxysporum species complex TaxID=171631 RepID=X0JWK5_FUSO5|nr:uncharacterized protein FOIG_07673 [Fusarium odoratissimum NRRL 54006]EXM00731.1 hypothetical protein FOIG_07673 [Fusarium odoratissimum NRRL 54006]TXB99236.1 hypothetical protein FocTR4_00013268 [Fusarium oxysporum f. sp. cubense]
MPFRVRSIRLVEMLYYGVDRGLLGPNAMLRDAPVCYLRSRVACGAGGTEQHELSDYSVDFLFSLARSRLWPMNHALSEVRGPRLLYGCYNHGTRKGRVVRGLSVCLPHVLFLEEMKVC